MLFLGGVAANVGIRDAFAAALGVPVIVPDQHNVMGAFGAALIAKRRGVTASGMRPLGEIQASDFRPETFVCPHCANACEIVRFIEGDRVVAILGGRCERWSGEDVLIPVGSAAPIV